MARWCSVWALDPGGTTGWAWACVDLDEVVRNPLKVAQVAKREDRMHSGQVGGSEARQVDRLVGMMDRSYATALCAVTPAGSVPPPVQRTLVVEDFHARVSNAKSTLLSPVRITNRLLERTAELFDGEPAMQSASDAKNVCSDERLKRWGFYKPGRPHENDAVRHLLLWLRKVA